MNALSLKNVGYTIREGFWYKKKKILQDVTLNINQGKTVGLVGQNGAGKTTLLKIAAGILNPEDGEAVIFGNSSLSISSKKKIAFLTENQYVYPHLTTREWLSLMGRCSGEISKNLSVKVDSLLVEFDLCDHSEKQMKDLSKGQKQRALIAQLFLNEPSVLILDEPMSGLDHVWREHMRLKLNTFRNEGGTIFFSSHILYDIETICDRIIYLKDGGIRWDGSVDDILTKSRMSQVVLKKNGETSFRGLGDVLWERGDQVSLLIDTDSFGRLQHKLSTYSSLTILRMNPYIPSLEAMFEI